MNVGEAKAAFEPDTYLHVERKPNKTNPSHAGLYTLGDLDIAVQLLALITRTGRIYPAIADQHSSRPSSPSL